MSSMNYRGKQMRSDSHAALVLAAIQRRPGLNTAALASVTGVPVRRVANACSRMVAAKMIVWTGEPRHRQYHPIELAPAGARSDLNARRKSDAPIHAPPVSIKAQLLERPQGETIMRDGVKVTICPSGRDQRFTFVPPPGWVGEITRDWSERRLGEATR